MNEKQIKMFQVLEEINCLHLDCLDEDWVQAIYHSEFLEIADFPADYESAVESVSISSVFHKVMRAVDTWLGLEAESEEDKSWAALSAQVPHQRLLAVLGYFIDYGTKNVHTKEYRNNALLASRVYYKFLSIPGYKAYHIYHAQLFTHSLACLSFPKEMCEKDENYFNTKELTREVNSVIRELRPYVLDLRSIVEKLQLKPTDMNFEDILSHLVDITGGAIVNKLNIDKLELANISQVIYVMIDTLIQDSTGEPDAVSIRLLFKCLLPKLVAASADCKNANNLVRASYVTYSGLLLSKYGKAAVSGFTVLLQHLCYTLDGLERAEVRQARVQLVVGMMTLLPRKSYRQTVKWLLKLTTTAKISHRYVALEILAKLLSNENDPEAVAEPPPPEPQPAPEAAAVEEQPPPAGNQAPEQPQGNEPVSDQLAREQPIGDQISNNQPPSDQAACDQSAVNQTDENQPGGEQTVNNQPIGSQSATDQLPGDLPVCDQLTDDQPVSDLPTDQQLPTDLPLDDLMTGDQFPSDSFPGDDQPPCEQPVDLVEQPPNGGDTPAEPPPVEGAKNPETEANSEINKRVEVSTEDESSQEMPMPKRMQCKVVLKPIAAEELKCYVVDPEEEVAGLLRARPHKVPHKDVLRAVHERANDISSTLRTRALTILADCCASNRLELKEALKEINGSGEVSRLVALAARCMSDERAAVRRAALLLMHKLMATNEENVTDTNLGVLVSLCRDASILVRGAAITSVGHLVVQWGRAAVMHAFLTGPVHQLSDPEPKIQEQVIAFIQQMLVERLEKFSPNGCEDLLPWTFLGAIAKHNMRRHLQKACTLLAKTAKCISVRTVDLLSTHLGALNDERDLQTLVMLTSVARHIDYHDVGFVLDYYYTLTEDMQGRDARLLPLVLELITEWSHWVTGASRAELRAHLVKALGAAQYGSDSCRTACAALAAHLDPVNLQWATELMQFYESRALNGGSIEEWVCAADMSLVAPQPPTPALLKLFLANVETPPLECDAASRGCMIAGLGRLCVRSRDAAAAAAPPLSKVLFSQSEPIAARVNALLALTDICTRYTCIVEPLLSSVMACLSRDTPPALRHAAATALTRLLLAGYLRLRTPLYYKYCALLADEDHDVREPAEYYVTCCLTADTIYHHFVECVLHYNKDDQTGPENKIDDNSAASGSPVPQQNAGPEKKVDDNSAASSSPVPQQNAGPEKEVDDNLAASSSPVPQQNAGADQNGRPDPTELGGDLSSLYPRRSESISFDARQLIYDVMLQRMSLVQKLNIQCRLAREVLGHAADMCDEGDEELSPSLQAALLDTITLLCGPRMKLPRKPDRNAGDADIDDLHERVTTNIVSHKMKRTVAEVLVPAVLRLYARMRSRGGQVVAYLVRIATDLLKDYRQEIEELIENDEELVDKVRQFQENIGEEPSFGNTRNLVTTSTSHEPETPRPSRRRPLHRTPRSARGPPAKRSLRV